MEGADTGVKCDEKVCGVGADRDRNLDVDQDYDPRKQEALNNKQVLRWEVDKDGWSLPGQIQQA